METLQDGDFCIDLLLYFLEPVQRLLPASKGVLCLIVLIKPLGTNWIHTENFQTDKEEENIAAFYLSLKFSIWYSWLSECFRDVRVHIYVNSFSFMSPRL